MAFNSKNLHYDKNEPAFLRKLRSEHGGSRETFQAARPKKDRLINDDDDAPAMVDEEGASVSKEEYEVMLKGKDSDGKLKDTADTVIGKSSSEEKSVNRDKDEEEAEKVKQKVADVGVAKKRKHVKIVGSQAGDKDEPRQEESKPVKKPKKKVKLSFDEPDG